LRLRGGVKPGHFGADPFRILIRKGGRGCLQWRPTLRRFVFVEGKSRREAARVFGLSRETVAKMCRYSAPPGYVRTKDPEKPKLGPLLPVIDAILEADKTAPPKQRHTAKRIFERLRIEHGFSGGYTVVKDYVRLARTKSREVVVPLAHPPGHAEVDFGECIGVIGGVRTKLHVFCFDLPHSDACFIKAYPAETTEAFLDGHVSAFTFFGGVPISILYDNLKIAVARILGEGKRQRTRAFTELVSHYLFQERFGRPGKGNDKGKVEALVKYSRANFLTPVPHAPSFEALNAALEERCRARQKECAGRLELTIGERLVADQAVLRPLPEAPFVRQAPGQGLLDRARALSHERLFRAHRLWLSRRPGERFCRPGGDHLRRG
jgi:transposase